MQMGSCEVVSSSPKKTRGKVLASNITEVRNAHSVGCI